MPISEHPSFDRPTVTTRLWRYTDLPKFIELLTSGQLWLSNAEILARDDPHEGLPGAIHFAHRMWRSIEEVPELLRTQIIEMCSGGTDGSPAAAFRGWVMSEEQRCIMTLSARRDFYLNCWHAADHESVAMWKVYGEPGTGVAILSNGGRIEAALVSNPEEMHLGWVDYVDPSAFQIGTSNIFDTFMRKRASYAYENEVRLVHWQTGQYHDPAANFAWNDETMRFDDLIEDTRPPNPGISLNCDLDVLIEAVIVSPFAPPWYTVMIERLRERLGYHFPVVQSSLLQAPRAIS